MFSNYTIFYKCGTVSKLRLFIAIVKSRHFIRISLIVCKQFLNIFGLDRLNNILYGLKSQDCLCLFVLFKTSQFYQYTVHPLTCHYYAAALTSYYNTNRFSEIGVYCCCGQEKRKFITFLTHILYFEIHSCIP